MIGWLLARVPAFTRRDQVAAYRLGQEVGFIAGYRQGTRDGQRLAEMKLGTTKTTLRLVKPE